MRKRRSTPRRGVTIAMTLLAAMPVSASAQIATDGSLGSGPAGALTPGLDATITIPAELGATICNDANTSCNVFHSFSEFNVNAGQTAAFTGPVGIDPAAVSRVLARVTGPSPSNIEGVLRTSAMPNADFFLMNPNGVVFRPGAQLDVGGSFVVTTANELRLADGQVFAAMPDAAADAMLTTAAPSAFGFLAPTPGPVDDPEGGEAPAGIEVQGSELVVPEGEGMSVVSGDIHISDSLIDAPSGRVNLIAGGTVGEVHLDATHRDASAPTDTFSEKGQVTVTSQTTVNVNGEGGGRIEVSAKKFNVDELSSVSAINEGAVGGGGINIALSGDLALTDRSSIEVGSSGVSDSGNLDITAGDVSFSVTDGEVCEFLASSGDHCVPAIRTFASGGGRGGDIRIQAVSMSLTPGDLTSFPTGVSDQKGGDLQVDLTGNLLVNTGVVSTQTPEGGAGSGGDILITAGEITFANASELTTRTINSGEGGDIHLNAGEIAILGSTPLTFSEGSGSGGSIELTADNVTVSNGGQIIAQAFGSGPGGLIKINAQQNASIDDSLMVTDSGGLGGGGNIQIQANDFTLSNAGLIVTITSGLSPAGHIEVAAQRITLINEGVMFTTTNGGTVPGGDIQIQANELNLESTGEIISLVNFSASGPGGNIEITAHQDFRMDDSSIFTTTVGLGIGGDLQVQTDDLTLDHGSRIATQTTGAASGGETRITATGHIMVVNQADIVTSDDSLEDAATSGDLFIEASSLELKRGGRIETHTLGVGKGGDIVLNVPHISIGEGNTQDNRPANPQIPPRLPFPVSLIGNNPNRPAIGSRVEAGGDGGKIEIHAEDLEILGDASITTSTFDSGNSGDVEVHADRILLDALDAEGVLHSAGIFTGSAPLGEIVDSDGDGGNVKIVTRRLDILSGAQISTLSFGEGGSGNVEIVAEQIQISDTLGTNVAGITTKTAGIVAAGRGGRIDITTDLLEIVDEGDINAVSDGQGQAGDITINATDVLIDGEFSILSTEARGQIMRGADLAVNLDISHPSAADATAILESPAGTRVILFSQLIPRSASERFADFMNTTLLDGAGVDIAAATPPYPGFFRPEESLASLIGEPTNGVWTLEVTDGFAMDDGTLNAWSLTVGDLVFDSFEVGQTITDADSVRSTVFVDAGPGAVVETAFESTPGDGGDIVMNVGSIQVSNRAAISASTEGPGAGGDVIIVGEDFMASLGGRVASSSTGQGPAGNVSISATRGVVLLDNAAIAVSSDHSNANDISITSGTTIDVFSSTITAEAGTDSGRIKLTAPRRVQLVDSLLTAQAVEDGGEIIIDPQFVILQNSIIDGRAGDEPVEVTIDPHAIFLNSHSQILTTAASLPPQLDLSGDLTTFPVLLLDTQTQLQERCAVQFGDDASSFTLSGGGGTALTPLGWLPSLDPATLEDGQHRSLSPPHAVKQPQKTISRNENPNRSWQHRARPRSRRSRRAGLPR